MNQAELPYNDTEGYVLRPASIDRAITEATDGTASRRQTQILIHLEMYQNGATWVEIGEALNLHHGQVSASLSVLHKAGKVFQLREVRGRSHPYVHANFRYRFTPEERYDEPTRTNAAVYRDRIDRSIKQLENAMKWLDELPIDNRFWKVHTMVRGALATLNGERDEG